MLQFHAQHCLLSALFSLFCVSVCLLFECVSIFFFFAFLVNIQKNVKFVLRQNKNKQDIINCSNRGLEFHTVVPRKHCGVEMTHRQIPKVNVWRWKREILRDKLTPYVLSQYEIISFVKVKRKCRTQLQWFRRQKSVCVRVCVRLVLKTYLTSTLVEGYWLH